MPTIKVNERDLSWYYRQRQPGQITVLMPGVATFGPCDANEGSLALVNETNFTRMLGTSSVDSRDFSYNVAKSYVKSGIDVLFWRIPLPGQATASYEFSKTTEGAEFNATGDGEVTVFTITSETLDLNDSNVILDIKSITVAGTATSDYTYDDTTRRITFTTAPTGAIIVTYDAKEFALTINAKYPGSFGNTLSVKVKEVSVTTGAYRVLVYSNKTNLVENFLVNFKDMDSEYYYTTVNLTTEYIDLVPGNSDYLRDLLKVEAVPLEGGSNGTYSPDAVTDYLAGSESNAIWSDLQDPLSRVFNVVTSAGYNNYTRSIFDSYVTSVATGAVCTINIRGLLPAKGTLEVIGVKGTTAPTYYKADGTVASADTDAVAKVVIATDTKTENVNDYTVGDYIKVVATQNAVSHISQVDDRFIGLCESTGLALYLVDGKQDWTAEEFYEYTSLPTQDTDTGIYSQAGFNTSYAAAIGPWCSAILTATGVSRMLPGSYVFLTQWAQSLATGTPMYYAPAGIKRASLNFVNSTAYPVGSAVLDLWQNHEIVTSDTHKVIPIANIRQYGYVIYGNSTLLKNLADGSTSMLQSLSTRIMSNMIKSVAFDISLTLQFDQISTDLFIEFREKLNMFMSQLKYNNALYDYEIVADTTNLTLDDLNSRTVPVKIRISPTPAAENFDITLEISQAGITFGSDDLQNTINQG